MTERVHESVPRRERGVALISVIFVLALATVLVLDLVYESRFYLRSSRGFVQSLQSGYMIKSAFQVGKLILAVPKAAGRQLTGSATGHSKGTPAGEGNEDTLLDPWAQVGKLSAGAGQLLDFGVPGAEIRLDIVDEDGKLNMNALASAKVKGSAKGAGAAGAKNPTPGAATATAAGTPTAAGGTGASAQTYRKAFKELFTQLGFQQEQVAGEQYETLGGSLLGPAQEVVTLQDWIDADKTPFSDPSFEERGTEGSRPPHYFYNRELQTLSELLLVPGMNRERLSLLGGFVKAGPIESENDVRINVNTAPPEVLVSLGLNESAVAELLKERATRPITKSDIQNLFRGEPETLRLLKTDSDEFSVIVRVKLPDTTRWGRALVLADPASGDQLRESTFSTFEFF